MSRLLNKAMLASCFGGLTLLVASGAHAVEELSGDYDTFEDGVLNVGFNTFGSYTVDGGSEAYRGGLAIGGNPGSSGQVSVTGNGTTLDFTGDSLQLVVGAQGAGQMTIADGAVVDGTGAAACDVAMGECVSQVGGSAGSNGSLVVTGEDSELLLLNTLTIGNANVFTVATDGFDFGVPGGATAASVDIRDGAILESESALLALGPFSGIGHLGADGTETVDAIVTVRGAGSKWIIDGPDPSDGFLNIASGQNTNGTLIVTSDGAVDALSLQLGFGDTDVGTMRISDGGVVNVRKLAIGENPNSVGNVTVSDALLTNEHNLLPLETWVIGVGGNASLNIESGGQVINDQGIDFMVAQFPASSANIKLTGTGSRIDVGAEGFIGFGWNLTDVVAGGKCKVTLGKGTVIRAGGIFVGPDCVINGKGTLQGFVTDNGGFIAPSITIEPIP